MSVASAVPSNGVFTLSDSSKYYVLASSVVFYYDFILTMPQEIKHVWSSKFNLVNVLVLALRYITVFGYVPIIMVALTSMFSMDGKCDIFGKLPAIIGIVCQGLTLVFLIIRLYAIFDKRRWILYATVPFGLLNVVLSSLAIVSADAVATEDSFGTSASLITQSLSCFVTPGASPSGSSLLRFRLSYITILLFDSLVFIMAVIRMRRMYHPMQLYGSRSSIVSILLRDGGILYAVLTISNFFNFIIFMRFFDRTNEYSVIFQNTFLFVMSSGTNCELTHALSVILVSRMIFNLREVGSEVYKGTEEWRSRVEREVASMRFRVPTTVHDGASDFMDVPSSDGGSGASGVDDVSAWKFS